MKHSFTNLLKTFLSVLLLTAGSASAWADSFTEGVLTYEYTPGETTCYVSECDYFATGDIDIPESVTYDGVTYSVTGIGNYAFGSRYEITSVKIPGSVTRIEGQAFNWCENLASVTLSEGLTHIAYSAFGECPKLTSLYIPSTVTSIDDHPFYGCTSLTEIRVDENNTAYASDGGALFNKAKTELLTVPGGFTSFGIPNGVTSIKHEAFRGCSNLTSVTLPDGLRDIWDMAFRDCSNLISIFIPSSVQHFGPNVFWGCI